MKNLHKLIASIALCEAVGILSTPFTLAAITGWYTNLIKPSFSPPNWIFGPVWTLLYMMMGISLFLIWELGLKKKKVKTAVYYFGAQLVLNFFWSIAFFGLRSPLLGLVNITILLGLILLTMKHFYPLSKPAFYLLVPYSLWVSFAAILNGAIVILN
ncbi:MAG: TspO/MBR family protein [Candidatus Gottesmanbacteria bacterium]|nr:TspO/MBR family protein [Candidatus Gottesmanbacteria bacterium]